MKSEWELKKYGLLFEKLGYEDNLREDSSWRGICSLSRCVVLSFPSCLNAFLLRKNRVLILNTEGKDLVDTEC